MRLADFDYELPEERIAQEPLAARDASRLLTLDRESGTIRDRAFRDLPGLLRANDVVVLNDTKVLPARLLGRKRTGGRVEIFLLEQSADELWSCLVKAGKSLDSGAVIDLGAGASATIVARDGDRWTVRLRGAPAGQVPLPRYIRRTPGDARAALDRERYQTVYARRPGAVAAPTAGLHFTTDLLDEVRAAGVDVAFLTLHTGAGTFLPIRTEIVEEHTMHAERFEISEETAEAIRRARSLGGRVVAVGTTVVRTLEARATAERGVLAGSGSCDLFLYPGYEFLVVDAMVTNFHLPQSSLLLLVCAFGGTERVLSAYRAAVTAGYRFYSYGDAMWIE